VCVCILIHTYTHTRTHTHTNTGPLPTTAKEGIPRLTAFLILPFYRSLSYSTPGLPRGGVGGGRVGGVQSGGVGIGGEVMGVGRDVQGGQVGVTLNPFPHSTLGRATLPRALRRRLGDSPRRLVPCRRSLRRVPRLSGARRAGIRARDRDRAAAAVCASGSG